MAYTPVPDFWDKYIDLDYNAARQAIGHAEWKLKELVRDRGVHLKQTELDAAIAEYQLFRTRLLEIQPHYKGLKSSFPEVPPAVPTTAPNP